MTEFVRRLLRLLSKVYKKHYVVTYDGKLISWNTVYDSSHWTHRSKLKNTYHEIFTVLLLKAKVKKVKEFAIVAFYNDNKDVDNVTIMTKWMVDVMKDKYVDNDDSRFYKGLVMFYDPAMKKKSIEIHIIGS